jgi:hypothetical protein
MSRISPQLRFCATALLILVAPALIAADSTPPSPKIQQRIDALLKHRLRPQALPVNPPNPFQVTGGVRRESAADESVSKPPVASEPVVSSPPTGELQPKDLANVTAAEVLIACATRLKLGGVIILKEQLQIVVNGTPRKEGDVVAADWNGSIVYLRIARLLPGQLVLRYDEAEATLKF